MCYDAYDCLIKVKKNFLKETWFHDSPLIFDVAAENHSGTECPGNKILSLIVFPISQPDTEGANVCTHSTQYLVGADKFGEQYIFLS